MNENQSLISKHAKSFNWAGFFLSKQTFKKCSILYDFCRTIDDIADENSELDIRKKNSEIKSDGFSHENIDLKFLYFSSSIHFIVWDINKVEVIFSILLVILIASLIYYILFVI